MGQLVRVASRGLLGLLLGMIIAAVLAVQFMGYRVLTIQSSSMEPSLSRGDLIFVRPLSIDSIELGDVVVFEQGRDTVLLVAHRVDAFMNVKINHLHTETGETTTSTSRLLITKGDANPSRDELPVDDQHFKGRVWFTAPGAGLILHQLPLQWVLLGVAAASTLAWWIYEAWVFVAGKKSSSTQPG